MFAATLLMLIPSWVSAQTYMVKRGDSLSTIAHAHGLNTSELLEVNNLSDPDHIEIGQTLTLSESEGHLVEGGVAHIVKRGVTLRRISQAYKVSLKRLVRANRIRNPDVIRLGREIFVPGADHVVPIATKRRSPCLNPPIEFYKIREDESLRVVLSQCNGKVWGPGREKLSRFLDRTREHAAPTLNRRLIAVLQRVASRWPDRRFEVVSAFRAPGGEQRASSRHCKAKALDFRVSGIRNERLRDFARTLGNVGVGYYPNSTFVHVDVRDSRAFWVDWSGPGEPARYGTLSHDPADGSQRSRGEPRRARRRGRRTNQQPTASRNAGTESNHQHAAASRDPGASLITPLTAAAP